MAIEIVRKRVCDKCGGDNGVSRVRLTLLGEKTKTATVDLCDDDRAPVLEIMDAKPQGLRKQRAVTPKKEVTARKRTRAKA